MAESRNGSSETARRAGVSTDTLRHYERKGLIPKPARLANGYRRYAEGTVERVRLVRAALAVGFSLDELAEILRARDGGHAPCRRVRALAVEKLTEVERRLAELDQVREQLVGLIAAWDDRLGETADGEQAHLLELITRNRRER